MKYNNYFKDNKEHRNFRKKMAIAAVKPSTFTLTQKYPLEQPTEGWPFKPEDACMLFNTTEGTEKGSLTGFQFALLLSGFGAFSSAGETLLFRSQSKLPMDEFKKVFKEKFNRESNSFTPLGLIDYVSKEKRTYNKNSTPLTPQMLADELYQLSAQKLPEKDKKFDQAFFDICLLAANLICEQIKEWKDLEKNQPIALKAIDEALLSCSAEFPKLANSTDALTTLTPENSSIDFDCNSLIAEKLDPALMPYQVVAAQAYLLRKKGLPVNKANLQKAITTSTNNALSWLFGNGLKLFKNASVDELCKLYVIQEQYKYAVERVKKWAEAIPKDALYGSDSYSKYRSLVGGKLDSWIANYVKRLTELEQILHEFDTSKIQLPQALSEDENHRLFSGTSLRATELSALITEMDEQRIKSQHSLNRLFGNVNQLPTQTDIDAFEHFGSIVNEFVGEVKSLKNRIDQEIELKIDISEKRRLESLQIQLPKWLKALPKVPSLSGGVPDYKQEVADSFERFTKLNSNYSEQIKSLIPKTSLSWQNILQASIEAERQHCQNHSAFNLLDFQELGTRRLLHKYLQQVKKLNQNEKHRIIQRMLESNIATYYTDESDKQKKDARVQLKDRNIFHNKQQKKSLNALILNEKGSIYVSPYSRRKHQAWALNTSALEKIDLLQWIESDLQWFESQIEKDPSTYFGYQLEWQVLRNTLLQLALPAQINTSDINTSDFEEIRVPTTLRAQLKQETINRDQLSKLLNLYVSELRSCLSFIFRERFFLRTRHSRVGDNKIHYVPKLDTNKQWQWQWQVPKQVLRSNKAISKHIQHFINNDGVVIIPSLKDLVKHAGKDWKRNEEIGALLREMPHDWYLDLGFDSKFNFSETSCFALDKKGFGKANNIKQGCRLIGSSRFKGKLDEQLIGTDINIGDYTLIIEQHFKQAVVIKDGHITPEISVDESIGNKGLKLEVALPLTEKPFTGEKLDFTQTYIGIDLGEVGIGYAVVDAKTHKKIDDGYVPIRSIRLLINAVKHHRKKKQPRQKFSQRFDTSLLELRENVVGDVCHVINSLMAHFKGVPILESSVGNLAAGSKQLSLVYDKILHQYLFSQTEAHSAARKHFWCGSENWIHPFATETVKKYGTDKEETRNLTLFPGSGVHPFGTSQQCSCCKENPHQLLKAAFALLKKGERLSTDENGLLILKLKNGEEKTLQFVSQYLGESDKKLLTETEKTHYENEIAKAKKQKERLDFKYPVKNKSFNFDEAKRQLKKQLRRAPRSLRSKDTTQSHYVCALKDCNFELPADINAAINIVFKWIKDRKITQ